MLKSTYQPPSTGPELPAGWTEHKAPTGHPYYYNAATKQSTYTRPIATEVAVQASSAHGDEARDAHHSNPRDVSASEGHGHVYREGHHQRQGWPQPRDRPTSKRAIPQCEPWLLVTTKLGRRFVYHPEQNESFWRFPPDVMKCVIEYDRQEREKKLLPDSVTRDPGAELSNNQGQASVEPGAKPAEGSIGSRDEEEDGDTADEDTEGTDDEHATSKRPKTDASPEDAAVEFNEEDIAYQLAAMGQEYGLDPGEYGADETGEWEEGAEGLALTTDDSNALFKDLLDDFHISPYTTWEKLIEDGGIVEDSRYTCLPNMKCRKEVWADWSRERIKQIKKRKEREEKKDPRIPYLSLLQDRATPKLYWPEFRRKYKKEPGMRDTKLADKEREKLYREYVTRLQLPESALKADLGTLLKSLPLHQLNRSTSLDALPSTLLTDLRYASLRPRIRDPLIEAYTSSLPPRPAIVDMTAEEEADQAKRRSEREARERALALREEAVQAEKRKQRGVLESSKNMLRDGEEEIQRAMQVSKQGLRGHLQEES